MQRYDPPRDGSWACLPMRVDIAGRYVLHSEARAEIERLEKEVEHQEKVIDWECVRRREAEAQRNTSWNDAIEAAAKEADELADEVKRGHDDGTRASSRIRALKRSQE